jgi:hypothetical protein
MSAEIVILSRSGAATRSGLGGRAAGDSSDINIRHPCYCLADRCLMSIMPVSEHLSCRTLLIRFYIS